MQKNSSDNAILKHELSINNMQASSFTFTKEAQQNSGTREEDSEMKGNSLKIIGQQNRICWPQSDPT